DDSITQPKGDVILQPTMDYPCCESITRTEAVDHLSWAGWFIVPLHSVPQHAALPGKRNHQEPRLDFFLQLLRNLLHRTTASKEFHRISRTAEDDLRLR